MEYIKDLVSICCYIEQLLNRLYLFSNNSMLEYINMPNSLNEIIKSMKKKTNELSELKIEFLVMSLEKEPMYYELSVLSSEIVKGFWKIIDMLEKIGQKQQIMNERYILLINELNNKIPATNGYDVDIINLKQSIKYDSSTFIRIFKRQCDILAKFIGIFQHKWKDTVYITQKCPSKINELVDTHKLV